MGTFSFGLNIENLARSGKPRPLGRGAVTSNQQWITETRKNKGLKDWASWAEEQINARDPVYKVASGMSLPGQNEPVRDIEA